MDKRFSYNKEEVIAALRAESTIGKARRDELIQIVK